jgi:hypothetical protein
MVWVAGCTRVLPWVMGVVVCFLCGKCFALAGDVCAALQLHDKGAAWLFSTVVMDALLSCQAVPYLDTGPCGIASTELSVEFVCWHVASRLQARLHHSADDNYPCLSQHAVLVLRVSVASVTCDSLWPADSSSGGIHSYACSSGSQ